MQIVKTKQELREWVSQNRAAGEKINLVPTMGFLHEGHFSLIRKAKESGAKVIVSVFVNPIQFGAGEDYEQYPRDLDRDAKGVEAAGGDLVFAPAVEEMYPRPLKTSVAVAELSQKLCGVTRPIHFTGVCTVVSKLLNLVQPDKAFFGQKDAQQAAILQTMVADLDMPVAIEMVPIVREKDGLALSSRNVYLSPEERKAALVLSASLALARKKIDSGEKNALAVKTLIEDFIKQEKLARIDYVSVCSYPDLQDLQEIMPDTLIALAVYIGKTRLIDNIIVRGKEQ
ncbi:MAG: pantoate--beta-alanine ligase [bacterium]